MGRRRESEYFTHRKIKGQSRARIGKVDKADLVAHLSFIVLDGLFLRELMVIWQEDGVIPDRDYREQSLNKVWEFYICMN